MRIANLKSIVNNRQALAFVNDIGKLYLISNYIDLNNNNFDHSILDPLSLKWLKPKNQAFLHNLYKNIDQLNSKTLDMSKWKLLSPIESPGKIIAVGRNYIDHVNEGKKIWKKRGYEVKIPEFPSAFAKYSSSIVGPNENIILPQNISSLDYEIELAVIIGTDALNIKENEALNYVAGYMICNDLSAREIQTKEMETQIGITLAKNFPTFCPLGPWFTSSKIIKNPQNLSLLLEVDGKVRQKANTKDMIFSVPKLISYWSQIGLKSGDIIITGTPSGVAIARDIPQNYYLKVNQIVTAKIEKLGFLKNKVM